MSNVLHLVRPWKAPVVTEGTQAETWEARVYELGHRLYNDGEWFEDDDESKLPIERSKLPFYRCLDVAEGMLFAMDCSYPILNADGLDTGFFDPPLDEIEFEHSADSWADIAEYLVWWEEKRPKDIVAKLRKLADDIEAALDHKP